MFLKPNIFYRTDARVVLAMYTLVGGRHASVDRADGLGTLSYISTQVYGRKRGSRSTLTSAACAELGSSTFAHIRPEHFLLALHGFDISREVLQNEDGSTEICLGPSDVVTDILRDSSSRRAALVEAVEKFKKKTTETRTDAENAILDAIEEELDDGGMSDDSGSGNFESEDE